MKLTGLGALSPAERSVLELMALGMRNAEIAAVLGKRPATVKQQVAAVLRKLGVHTRAAAAVVQVTAVQRPPRPGQNRLP